MVTGASYGPKSGCGPSTPVSGRCGERVEDPPTSARSIRHAWLTDLTHQTHQQSRGTYGASRVHAELTLGYGVRVGRNAVAMLMRRVGLAGPRRTANRTLRYIRRIW